MSTANCLATQLRLRPPVERGHLTHCARPRLLQFFIALLAVTQRQADANGHESKRRNEQDYNSASDRLLSCFGDGPRGAVAHSATLSKNRTRPKHNQQS